MEHVPCALGRKGVDEGGAHGFIAITDKLQINRSTTAHRTTALCPILWRTERRLANVRATVGFRHGPWHHVYHYCTFEFTLLLCLAGRRPNGAIAAQKQP